MVVVACPEAKVVAEKLLQEAHELNLIFNSIVHKLRGSEK